MVETRHFLNLCSNVHNFTKLQSSDNRQVENEGLDSLL